MMNHCVHIAVNYNNDLCHSSVGNTENEESIVHQVNYLIHHLALYYGLMLN